MVPQMNEKNNFSKIVCICEASFNQEGEHATSNEHKSMRSC